MNIPFFNSKKIKELQQLLDQKESEFNKLKNEFEQLKAKRDLTEKDVIASSQPIVKKMIQEAEQQIIDSKKNADLLIEEANLKAKRIIDDTENKALEEMEEYEKKGKSIIDKAKSEAELITKETRKEVANFEEREKDYIKRWNERVEEILENAYNYRDEILNKTDYEILIEDIPEDIQKNRIDNYLICEDDQSFKLKINSITENLKRKRKYNSAVTADVPINCYLFREVDAKPLSRLALAYFDVLADNIIKSSPRLDVDACAFKIKELTWKIRHSLFSFRVNISEEYFEEKVKYLRAYYDYEKYKQRKKEELAYEREMKREEEKAQREYERAIRQSEKDEEKARRLIEEAQKKLQQESLSENKYKELQQQIEKLKSALEDAVSRGERAKSMAEQTRRGYVYVISNLGSFGEDVFKIGLTRRLDPTERVDELSNASVPFPFDIHAIIESEDAPALESALHKAFDSYKLNKTNWRKEFFKVPLSEIERVVNESGIQAVFIKEFSASQYRESLSIVKAI